jgi:hypothetical protein
MRLLVGSLLAAGILAATHLSAAGGARVSPLYCQAMPPAGYNSAALVAPGQWTSNSLGGGYVSCPIPNTFADPAANVTEIWGDFYNTQVDSSSNTIQACVMYYNGTGGTCTGASQPTPNSVGAHSAFIYAPGFGSSQYQYDYPYVNVYITPNDYFLGYGVITST